jgi:urease beta subunit
MLPRNFTAVVGRNDVWQGKAASEPYECGWAREAIVFLRALEVTGKLGTARARVQISPDGQRWLDEGTSFRLPQKNDAVTFARVAHFGNWLRIAVDLPKGARLRVIPSYHLKA